MTDKVEMSVFMRFVTVLTLFALATGLSLYGEDDPDDWFAFRPEGGTAPSVLDASDWLDAPAGKHGFVQQDGDRFVFEDGTPVTFWGVNIAGRRAYPERGVADAWAGYLARHGINAVRFHKFTWAGYEDEPYSTVMDTSLFDRLDYFSAALRERGIYYGWSHIYGHKPRPGDRDRLLAYDEVADIEVPWSHLNASTSGLVNFAPDLQDLHIELTTNMLNRRNPHTGLRYAEDPALNFVELQNEDNIFWGALDTVLEQTPTYRALLSRQFSEWLEEKYATHEDLVTAWGEEALAPDAHLDAKNIYPRPDHHWFQEAFEQAAQEERPVPRDVRDRARFLYETQVDFYERFVDSVRATGYKGPIVGSCWQAGVGLTHFYNLHADYRVGFVDRHNYFGGGTGHGLTPGAVENDAMVSRPGSGLLSTGMQQVDDRPFALSEWMSLLPNEWTAEAAPLIAVYGMGLQGWDASYAYASNQPTVTRLVQAPRHGVYNADSPLHVTLYPALARMVYRGDVEEGDVVSRRNVHVPSLDEGRVGFEENVDQQHDVKRFEGTVPTEALAAGRVVVDFTDAYGPTTAPDLSPYVDRDRGVVHSTTDQLAWHYGAHDYFTVDTPGTKAVVGFAEQREHDLGAVSLSVDNPFGVVFVTSLDRSAPITEAQRILVTTVARARNTGMQYADDQSQLLAVGEAPVRMEPVRVDLSIRREGTPTVHVLDHDGRRTGRTVPVDADTLTLDGARHETIYYELEYE